MDSQSLYQILYIFLDWHPAQIKTFAELICAVVKAKTVRIKELALYVASKGNLHSNSKYELEALKYLVSKINFS